MRKPVTVAKLQEFMTSIGRAAKTPGVIYLTGGSTALLLGFRDQTIDVDIKLDPEPEGVFEAIAKLKISLGVNVELASPDQFIPPLPGWRERSLLILTAGKVEFRHFDFYSQALSKLERGYAQDLADVRSLVENGKINVEELGRLAESIGPDFVRYPSVNLERFAQKVKEFLQSYDDENK
jgi:hypothetical protein